ncbi:hypothetical protein [Clostridium sp. UBA4548]|uniref:hypothetical protein n=1 Tax=Clostridium sp. UBA4548 TaxID=1946361 RepID=UPI0025B86F7F|nr:hypothetical protein [Clostridium sp. UBA4548]
MEYVSFIVLILALYLIVIIIKRLEDKERKVLTIEEFEHLIIWRNDPYRKVNPPEKLESIIEKIKMGEIVEVKNKRVYKNILKITTRNIKFNNLILIDNKK